MGNSLGSVGIHQLMCLLELIGAQGQVRFQQAGGLRDGLQSRGQKALLHLGVAGRTFLYRATQLREALVQRRDGLGSLLLQVAHLGQLGVLLLRNAGHGLGIVDNLVQPGALLRGGVRDGIGQQLLALEGPAHQLFGASNFLLKAGDLLIAVLGARELQLLLGAAHRSVSL